MQPQRSSPEIAIEWDPDNTSYTTRRVQVTLDLPQDFLIWDNPDGLTPTRPSPLPQYRINLPAGAVVTLTGFDFFDDSLMAYAQAEDQQGIVRGGMISVHALVRDNHAYDIQILAIYCQLPLYAPTKARALHQLLLDYDIVPHPLTIPSDSSTLPT